MRRVVSRGFASISDLGRAIKTQTRPAPFRRPDSTGTLRCRRQWSRFNSRRLSRLILVRSSSLRSHPFSLLAFPARGISGKRARAKSASVPGALFPSAARGLIGRFLGAIARFHPEASGSFGKITSIDRSSSRCVFQARRYRVRCRRGWPELSARARATRTRLNTSDLIRADNGVN